MINLSENNMMGVGNIGQGLINSFDMSSPEISNTKEGFFQRYEDKILLTSEEAEYIKGIVEKKMSPSYLDANVEFTLIESIYFDSPALGFFRHHMEGREDRYKMRLRHYGPNGFWAKNDRYLLEIKRKQAGVTKKKRFVIPEEGFDDIRKGRLIPYPLTREFRDVNSEVTPGKLVKRVNFANDLMNKYELSPKLIIQYLRYAYEDQEGKFRVTFDSNLIGDHVWLIEPEKIRDIKNQPYFEKVQRFGDKFSEDMVVMELKHLAGGVPNWMEDALTEIKKEKGSFSKYCYFTAKSVLAYL